MLDGKEHVGLLVHFTFSEDKGRGEVGVGWEGGGWWQPFLLLCGPWERGQQQVLQNNPLGSPESFIYIRLHTEKITSESFSLYLITHVHNNLSKR
jgi:hypothetical protein